MHAEIHLHQRAAMASTLAPNQAFGAVAAVIVFVLAAFAPTTVGMIEIWRRSETFTHGFLVFPAVLWFIWTRREELARTPIRPTPWALLPLMAAGLLWLVGQASASLAPAQLGMVAMIPCVIASLFGWGWVRALMFP